MINKSVVCVLALSAFGLDALAQGRGGPPDRFEGTFFCENETVTINEFACSVVQQAGFVDSCTFATVTQILADGAVLTGSFPRTTSFGTELYGTWKKDGRLLTSSKQINQGYSNPGTPTGYGVVLSTSSWDDSYGSFTGEYEVRSYGINQDPLDVMEIPTTITLGNVFCRRL